MAEESVRKLSFLGFHTKNSSGNEDPDEVLLDSEMEKVFAGPNALKKKFDVSTFQDAVQPLGSYKPRTIERKNLAGDFNIDGDFEYELSNTEPVNVPNCDDVPEDFPLVSERAGHGEHSDISTDEKHVQFDQRRTTVVVSSNLKNDEQLNDNVHERKRRKSRHQYYRQRKFSHQDNVEAKKMSDENSEISQNKITALEDATLEEADLNELRSHRSEDPRALRRHKIHHASMKLKELSQISTTGLQQQTRKTYDHSPHEVFVQLDELIGTGEEREWKETARWIKYEEDVQEGSDRWGRPHVASLSFHSLLNLRRCLETGVVLLDLNERDLPAVVYRVVEQMVVEDLIRVNDKPALMRSLLLRHRHVNEHQSVLPFTKRKYNSYSSLQVLWWGNDGQKKQYQQQLQQPQQHEQEYCLRQNRLSFPTDITLAYHRRSFCGTLNPPPVIVNPDANASNRRHSTLSHLGNLSGDEKKIKIAPAFDITSHNKNNELKINMKDEVCTASQEDLKKAQNDTILKRIPQGSEATTVLVGAVDFLEQPTIAFLRLAEGIAMPSLTEVPIPVRFMFILLGPPTLDLDYHEVGRSIATLMANDTFHSIAYKADDRKDLLSAINEFLDDSIVLPPGNWDRHDLIPFEELKAKKDWIRSRKTKALQFKKELKDGTTKQTLKIATEKKLSEFTKGEKEKRSPLQKTNRLWGGLRNDLKRRLPMYKSDVLDGFNSETLAATVFMYFACLSTAITFGGLVSDKTHNLIGISETLLSASIVGVIFHSLAGQPLVIIGTTGPLLLFDEALNNFCKGNQVSFLTIRAYIGIWLALISILVSAFEGSVYVRLLTRFTQEIFSALITLIYIFETVMKLVSVYQKHPLLADYNLPPPTLLNTKSDNNESSLVQETNTLNSSASLVAINFSPKEPINMPNTALFCTILTLGTFTVAYYLKSFRNSNFFGRNARRALGDFGVPIAITIFVMVDYFIPEVYTEKLSVPEGLSPSDSDNRRWLVNLGPIDTWVPFAAGIPALLVYILIFMESHISELIVDKPERGLKKGSGLHFDIVLLCCLNTFCGFFGMPWHCAATVRSVAHVSALTVMSRTHAPGESPRIIDVKEQRVSGFFVSLMIGLSVTMAPLLRLIPMAVLFGVFLYMGIASMSGVQFFERVRLFFMPVKHYPPTAYVQRVPTWKMHMYTIVQVVCLAILWTVKSSKISLAFPFFLIVMIPLRQKLTALYKLQEIQALDGREPQPDKDEPDFYEEATIPA